MKQLLALCISTFVLSTSICQTNSKKNDIYFELGGNGLFASVNYERQLTTTPKLGVRLGLGYYTENAFYLSVPVGVNYLFPLKNKNSFVECGFGATWTYVNGNLFAKDNNLKADNFINYIPSIGYRVHTNRNVMWRINVSPIINTKTFFPWIGFSLGKRF